MRTLANEAGVNLGAATYHYGSKENLYRETVMRRFRPIGEERISLLQQAEEESKGKPVPVNIIVDCMLRPPFMAGITYPSFSTLFARNLFMPPPFMKEFLAKEGVSFHEPFIAALVRTLPHLSPEVLRIREICTRGVLLIFSSKLSRMQTYNNPAVCESILQEMVTFVTAGLCTESKLSDADLSPVTSLQSPPSP